MGPMWKTLQRYVDGAAFLTLIHWAALRDWGGIGPALDSCHLLCLRLTVSGRICGAVRASLSDPIERCQLSLHPTGSDDLVAK